MGMFDSVYVPCPKCEQLVEFQSKAGQCTLEEYSLDNAPSEVLLDINTDIIICDNCKTRVTVDVEVAVKARVRSSE